MATRSELYTLVEPFRRPRRLRAVMEAVVTFVPYLTLSALMVIAVRRGHPWITGALSVLAAGFLVRVFMIFHDCTHGSFFASRRANRIVGYAAGLLTLTPFDKWQGSHAVHHATAGDLDRRGSGDMWMLTVDEYRAAPAWRRLFYRVFRNPFVMLGIGPALVFVASNRLSSRGATGRERFSVYFTNAGIVVTVVAAWFTIGLPALLLTQLPTTLLAGAAGVWLFYVQHQFEDAYWARRPAWEPLKAALEGSSYYKLPAILRWFTANIGLHHVHHVQPRIPFYNLQRCQAAIPAFRAVRPLTIRRSLRSLHLRLWDDTSQRLIRWRDVRARRTDGRQSGVRCSSAATNRIEQLDGARAE